MTTPTLATPLSEADLDRLEEMLRLPVFGDDSMALDAMQGFFCAIVSGPDPVAPSRWLPVVLGSEPDFEAGEQAAEILALLMRMHNQVAMAFEEDEGLDFILYPDEGEGDDGESDFGTWCAGYVEGMRMSERDWFEAADAEEVEELALPVLLLAAEGEEFDELVREAQLDARTPKARAALLASAREELPDAIFDIHRYWKAMRNAPGTIRRSAPKVGRNDPCPCGSGKKFKVCCGAQPLNS